MCASTYATYVKRMQVNNFYGNCNNNDNNTKFAVWHVDDAVLPALTAISFVVYVLANLVPRAIAHH